MNSGLSSALPGLPAEFLGPDVLMGARFVADVQELLFPEEALLVARAVERRRVQFASGRVLARALLEALGEAAAPLLRGEDRVPLWPAQVMGSLSHTDQVVLAAVARPTADVLALGVDVEADVPLEQELWSSILTDSERQALDAQPAEVRGRMAKLVFSAKESVYKAQFALSRCMLDFQEVELVLLPEARMFEARLPEKVVEAVGRATLAGRWWRGESGGAAGPQMVTAVVVR